MSHNPGMASAKSDPDDRPRPGRFEFPEFRARLPWWGPDLQTLRNPLRVRATRVEGFAEQRLELPLGDGSGDALVATLNGPSELVRGPLVVLIHGLSGSEESAYMLTSARHWLARGHRVLRLNLRGAGPSRASCRLQYHAGKSADLRDALLALRPELLADGVILVGYSLGGNVLLKFLAEYGAGLPIVAAASVSAPIDLSAASQRFLAPRNRVYHRHLLRSMKAECFGGAAVVSPAERERVLAAQSILEFDEVFVAPRNGFEDAEHYYAECHARRFLADIEVPTLLVHALDDPWIPAESYTIYAWEQNPNLHPLLASGGGHVGFHDGDRASPYHDRCVARFVDEVAPGRA
jgi:predicted alpha/beta-fold hydrolase